jgi:peptide/nickel transport system permease protein
VIREVHEAERPMRNRLKRLPWEAKCGMAVLIVSLFASVLWTVAFPDSMEASIQNANRPPALWSQAATARGSEENALPTPEGPLAMAESPSSVTPGPAVAWHESIFGTQRDGIDTFAYTVSAAQRYLIPVCVLVAVVLVVGSCFGVFSGYYERSWMASVVDFSSNAISVYPPLILLILIVYILHAPSFVTLAVAYGLTEATRLGNLIRNKIGVLKKEDFIAAAQEMGMSDRRIILRHILWYNCRELLVIQSVFSTSSFVMIELYLGYLNKADSFNAWGKLIGPLTSRGGMEQYPWYVLPSLIVVVVVGSLYLLGDGLIRHFSREERT